MLRASLVVIARSPSIASAAAAAADAATVLSTTGSFFFLLPRKEDRVRNDIISFLRRCYSYLKFGTPVKQLHPFIRNDIKPTDSRSAFAFDNIAWKILMRRVTSQQKSKFWK